VDLDGAGANAQRATNFLRVQALRGLFENFALASGKNG
jgi:hypothetical protein